MLGPAWWRLEVGIREAEALWRNAVADQVTEGGGGGLVMEGFVDEEMDFEWDLLWDSEPAN